MDNREIKIHNDNEWTAVVKMKDPMKTFKLTRRGIHMEKIVERQLIENCLAYDRSNNLGDGRRAVYRTNIFDRIK